MSRITITEFTSEEKFERMASKILGVIKSSALSLGRIGARPLLQLAYVMKDGNLSSSERIKIYAALCYTLFPADVIPARVYRILGLTDDVLAVAYVYRKVRSNITPEINLKVEQKLDEWFGYKITVPGV